MKLLLPVAVLLAAQPVVLAAETVERVRYLMGSPCRITAAHPVTGEAAKLVERAFDEIDRWNSILSDWDAGSELSRLNASAPRAGFTCSDELYAWLDGSLDLARATGGAFDPTVGSLVDLYAIRSGGRWPSDAEVAAARGRVGPDRIALDAAARTATFLTGGVRLDPGGNGKGWALDEAARVLREGGAEWALLDFGGQILAVGPGPGGAGFPVEIPQTAGGAPEVIRLADASAATSSNAERGLEVEGRLLGHIIDPRTARPAGWRGSVTVVAPTARQADALSTAFFVMGPDEALRAAREMGVEARFVAGPDRDPEAPRTTPGFASLLEAARASPAPSSGVGSPSD